MICGREGEENDLREGGSDLEEGEREGERGEREECQR